MKRRIITGLLILLAVFPPLAFGGIWLQFLILAVVGFGSYEVMGVYNLKNKSIYLFFLIAFILGTYYLPDDLYAACLALFILALFFVAMLDQELNLEVISYIATMVVIVTLAISGIRHIYSYGPLLMLFVFLACFGSDVGAYFVGVTIGKHKLLERISPKKTWEGSIGGWLFAMILSFVAGVYLLDFPIELLVFLSVTIPVIGQLGDLAFSLIKRNYGIKDFGNLFPGHGGVLDRVDSLLFCLMYMHAILLLVEKTGGIK